MTKHFYIRAGQGVDRVEGMRFQRRGFGLGNKDREKKLTALLTLDGELQREDPKAKLRFNDELGFWTIKKTETTEQFLKWWAERWSIPFNS